MIEDEEELGGTAMAENLRALERTLSLNIREGILEGEDDSDDEDMDDEDEDDDEDDDDEGDDLTAEEIRTLTSGRSQIPQILIDDFGGGKAVKGLNADENRKGKGRGFANGLTAGAGAPPSDMEQQRERRRKEAMNDQAEEISVDELFRGLCVRGRDYITVKDIKKWDYLQELMKVRTVLTFFDTDFSSGDNFFLFSFFFFLCPLFLLLVIFFFISFPTFLSNDSSSSPFTIFFLPFFLLSFISSKLFPCFCFSFFPFSWRHISSHIILVTMIYF